MRIRRTLMIAAATAVALLAGAPANAAGSYLVGYVNRVFTNGDDTWGGCMALLSVDPASLLPSCAGGWVSFSCSGSFTDPVRAYRMLDQAQLALAANKLVGVYFQDDKQHNGYCFASRIDVFR